MKEESKIVKVKGISLTVYPWSHRSGKTHWRFAWYDQSGRRKYTTKAKRSDAIAAARAKAREIHNGSLDLGTLTPEQIRLCRAFVDLSPDWNDIQRLRTSKERGQIRLADARKKFLSAKMESAGEQTQEIGKIRRVLERFSAHVGEGALVREIFAQEIAEWLTDLEVGPKRRKAIRDNLCQFWRWMRNQDLIVVSSHLTEPEKTPAPKIGPKGEVRILSIEEMKIILKNVRSELLPWVVINGFSGLRVSEIRSAKKPPLLWRHIDREDRCIEVPAVMSKKRKRRFAPILPTLEAWLSVIPAGENDEPVIRQLPTESETARLGQILDDHFKRSEGWPDNCLRHSYGSYRVAETKDIASTAHEMDNSESVIRSNYLKAVKPAESKAYFGLLPGIV